MFHFICPNDKLWLLIRRYFGQKGYILSRLPSDQPVDPGGISYLFIYTPLNLAGHIFTVETLWSHFLKQQPVDARIIRFGFSQAPSAPHYMGLFNLPENLESFANSVEPVKSALPSAPLQSYDLIFKVYRFFKGHDDKAADSIIAGLETIRSRMQSLFLNYQNRQNQPYLELLENILNFMDLEEDIRPASPTSPIAIWENFKNRWDHYFPLFEWTPFYPELQTVNQLINRCFPFFQSGWKAETELTPTVNHLNQIHSTLQQIEDDYAGLFPKK